MKKIVIYFCRLLKKEKTTLNQRAEYLFKAFEHITEDCSPISKAKVFEIFKHDLISYLKDQRNLHVYESKKSEVKSNSCERAIENI